MWFGEEKGRRENMDEEGGKGKEMDEPCREEPCFCRLGMANTPSAFIPREGEGERMRVKG